MIANSSWYFSPNRGGNRFLAMVYQQIPEKLCKIHPEFMFDHPHHA
jgi:hypothetical protein